MRIGVISDIHGNDVALRAVLEGDTGPIDGWVCLGDAVQGGVDPRAVYERLKTLGCQVVMGNSDAFLLGEAHEDDATAEQKQIRDWTADQIGADGLDYVRSFAPVVEHDLEGPNVLHCFHGSPSSYHDVLLPDTPAADLRSFSAGFDGALLCGGHTHLQWMATVGTNSFFNPGSVGLAYNRLTPLERFSYTPIAQYATVTTSDEGATVEFAQVVLDPAALERAALASTHPFREQEAVRFRPPA